MEIFLLLGFALYALYLVSKKPPTGGNGLPKMKNIPPPPPPPNPK